MTAARRNMSYQTPGCPVCATRLPDAGPCEWCRSGVPVPACRTCRESGPEGQTLMFATMAITEATCKRLPRLDQIDGSVGARVSPAPAVPERKT